MKLPNSKPAKLGTCFQPDWSIDKLLTELQESGTETALRVKRTKSNEVTITVNCRNTTKDVHSITRALFTLYGITK